MLCGWGVNAGMVHSICGQTCGWQVKLCDPSLTRAMPERLRDDLLVINRYTSRHLTYLFICLQNSNLQDVSTMISEIVVDICRMVLLYYDGLILGDPPRVFFTEKQFHLDG